MLTWEETACDGCGADEAQLVFEGPDRLLGLPGMFRLVKCRRCGLIRQNPRLAWESLKNYYSGDYLSYAPLIKDEASRWRRLDRRYGMWKQRRVVERFHRGGRLLDVGCGTGIFLEEALRSGRWQVTGIEPTAQAAAYARQALGVEVHQGRFSEAALPEDSFDVITMWNVLEHLPAPVADLRHARRLLRQNGCLVFTIPNVESLEASLFGSYWVGWDLPRHLYLFPRHTLGRLLAALGFQVVFAGCISSAHASLRDSLEFWSQSWSPAYLPYKSPLLRAYRTLPVRIGLGLPLWVLDRLNLSTILTLVARKTGSPEKGEHQ